MIVNILVGKLKPSEVGNRIKIKIRVRQAGRQAGIEGSIIKIKKD